MKIRNGFISNSSSTTFVCPACGNHNFGWDWDEDPICKECGIHILKMKEPFAQFLIKKYKLNEEEERLLYATLDTE